MINMEYSKTGYYFDDEFCFTPENAYEWLVKYYTSRIKSGKDSFTLPSSEFNTLSYDSIVSWQACSQADKDMELIAECKPIPMPFGVMNFAKKGDIEENAWFDKGRFRVAVCGESGEEEKTSLKRSMTGRLDLEEMVKFIMDNPEIMEDISMHDLLEMLHNEVEDLYDDEQDCVRGVQEFPIVDFLANTVVDFMLKDRTKEYQVGHINFVCGPTAILHRQCDEAHHTQFNEELIAAGIRE